MPQVGLSEAARLTRRNQSTIHRAMKTGRISFTVSPTGERQVDTAELDRVFGVNGHRGNGASNARPGESQPAHAVEIALLRQQLHDRDESIRDLRARFDASEAERRAVQAQLTALLTDQRPTPAAPDADRTNPPAAPRRSWWPWRRS